MFEKRRAPADLGLEQIASWHSCFVSGHAARLAEANLAPDEHASELATIMRQAAAIRERLESDYRLNRTRR